MDTIKLQVHEREETGNGPARRLRAKGMVPAVSYGKGNPATPLSVDSETLKAAMAHGHNVVIELDFGKSAKGKAKAPRYAVLRQIQYHPTKRNVLHVDLHEVDLGTEIEAAVTVEVVGTPAGLADGGILEWERREVMVRALPVDIPQAIELDVSGLYIGHHLTVEALQAPEGVTIVDEPDTLIVALLPPRVEQAPAEAEEEVEEPEVIGGAKTEE